MRKTMPADRPEAGDPTPLDLVRRALGSHNPEGDCGWPQVLAVIAALTRAPSGETTTGGAEDGPWYAGAIGRDPDDNALVWRDDAVTGPQLYAASPKQAEYAAIVLNGLERRLRAQPASPGPCRPGAWGSKGCVVHEGHDIGADGLCIEGRASGCPYPHPHPSHPCADRPSTCRACGEKRTLGDGLGRGICRECWDAGKGKPDSGDDDHG